MKKEQILLKVFRSRKAYLSYYLFIAIIIGVLIFLYSSQGRVDSKILIVSAVFIAIVIKVIEINRIRDWWAITDSTLIESKSILNKNVREIDFNSIADIDLDQEWYKRILGYGTVNIRKFLNEKSIIVCDINEPVKFINILQEAIQKRRHK